MRISLPIRPRRNRVSASIRSLTREHFPRVSDLIAPLFVIEGSNKSREVKSMPGVYRLSSDLIVKKCERLYSLGLPAVVLFPALEESLKTSKAEESYNDNGLYQRTIRAVKKEVPELTVITDVAMDPYNSDGHDGWVNKDGKIVNDETLPILAKMAVSQALAGADIVAPSDMMDGRVSYIRRALDERGFSEIGIMAYSTKYASAYYGPFRNALDSAPKHGDKKTYQMDPGNVREALREVLLDIEEGADIVMIKPGLPYLDVARAVSEAASTPTAVYNVSGEYAMVKAAAIQGWIDYESAVMENMICFKRAGVDMILTYHAEEVAEWLSGDLNSTTTS